MAFLHPATASTVRLIRSSRAGVKTCKISSASYLVREETVSDLNPHVVRDPILFYEAAHEIKVRVASSRVCDLNLLIPAFDEQLKESRFLFNGHGIRKGLIPIPKVCGKPYWRYSRPFGRPLTVLKMEGSVRFVSLRGVNTRKCKSARVCVLKPPKKASQHARHDGIVADSWCPRSRQTKKMSQR